MNTTLILFFSFVYIYHTCSCETNSWEKFKKLYKKSYTTPEEENHRRSVFLKNLQFIEDHNKKYEEGLVTYSVGVNKFADYTAEELFPKSRKSNGTTTRKRQKLNASGSKVPDAIDWRDYGVINPILDQDYCLSCWAFAVVAAVEAHVGIHLGQKNLRLSEENLIDCVYSDFDCKQEMERTALEDSYQYIIDNGGIDTDDAYPYDQITTECRYKPESKGASIENYATIPEGDEEEMKNIVGTLGPVSVILTVETSFMIYRSGVYYKENCVDSDEPYNHAVTVIGYGVEDGQDYWLVRNEWSTIFGDEGYIKVARNRNNTCGIATYASYPVV